MCSSLRYGSPLFQLFLSLSVSVPVSVYLNLSLSVSVCLSVSLCLCMSLSVSVCFSFSMLPSNSPTLLPSTPCLLSSHNSTFLVPRLPSLGIHVSAFSLLGLASLFTFCPSVLPLHPSRHDYIPIWIIFVLHCSPASHFPPSPLPLFSHPSSPIPPSQPSL